MSVKPPPQPKAPIFWLFLGLGLLLAGTLACAGGGNNLPDLGSAPPGAPGISLPASGTVGFQVIASAQPVSGSLAYKWTISPGAFKGGVNTASGASVAFTPTGTGSVTLTCQAIKGNAILSETTARTLVINQPSKAGGGFEPAGALAQGRLGLAAALIPTGSILVMGGTASAGGPALKGTEIYAIATGTSAAGHDMVAVRAGQAVTALDAARFLVTGGTGAAGVPPLPHLQRDLQHHRRRSVHPLGPHGHGAQRPHGHPAQRQPIRRAGRRRRGRGGERGEFGRTV